MRGFLTAKCLNLHLNQNNQKKFTHLHLFQLSMNIELISNQSIKSIDLCGSIDRQPIIFILFDYIPVVSSIHTTFTSSTPRHTMNTLRLLCFSKPSSNSTNYSFYVVHRGLLISPAIVGSVLDAVRVRGPLRS